jgi:hypothetical protein
MKSFLVVAILAIALAAPASAQQATGMGAMTYYVGTWTCLGGPVGVPPAKATLTYVMNGSILNQNVSVPVQPGISSALTFSFSLSYDGAKGQYVQTALDESGSWSVSSAKPWTGNTEEWTDVSSADGKLGRGEAVRTDQTHYTFTGYPTLSGSAPNFKVSCLRQ